MYNFMYKKSFSVAALLVILMFGSSFITPAFSQALLPSFGDARSGTSGFQFIKISVDPRSASMGNSATADAFDGSSLYWNPALAVQLDKSQFFVSHTAYFVDVSKEYVSYIQKLKNIAIGVSLQYLNSGDITETTEFQPYGTGRTFRTIHYSAGLTVSQKLTSLFSYGVTLRYLDERIEEVEAKTGAIDLGFFYKVGDTGLRFAIGLNNFGLDVKPTGTTKRPTLEGTKDETGFKSVSLPTTFILAAAFDVIRKDNMNLLLTGQLTNPSDNAEKLSIGAEYGFLHQFYLRGGYEFGTQELRYPSGGLGIKIPLGSHNVGLDYGFTNYDRLGNIHRLALKISL